MNPFSNPVGEKLEKKILTLLRKDLTPKEIFGKIKDSSDINQVSRFLYNSVLDKTLLEFSINRLERNKPVSWPYLLKLFEKYQIKPSKKLEQILFHYFLKHKKNQSPALFACKSWGDISSDFQNLYSVYIQELEEEAVSEEKDLLEKLEFAQAQNLIKEEEEIIGKLLLINPHSVQYKKLQKKLEEKKASNLIEEEKKWDSLKNQVESYIFYSSPEEKNLKETWFQSASSVIEKDRKHTKNLSLFFSFCGWPDTALKVLDTQVSQISDYWFYLDWIFETKEYARGLELINRLFEETKESESFFLPLFYIKSQLLYALGRKKEAIEYFTAISQVQPNYRNVEYLLAKWMKNE